MTAPAVEATHEELTRRVDDLRAFEREYRSRLTAYLEGQLRDLDEPDYTERGEQPVRSGTVTVTREWQGIGSGIQVRLGRVPYGADGSVEIEVDAP